MADVRLKMNYVEPSVAHTSLVVVILEVDWIESLIKQADFLHDTLTDNECLPVWSFGDESEVTR